MKSGEVCTKPMVGFLIQKGSLWIGAHWSAENRRWCINPLPCVTIWIALKGGRPPHKVCAE